MVQGRLFSKPANLQLAIFLKYECQHLSFARLVEEYGSDMEFPYWGEFTAPHVMSLRLAKK